MTDNPPATLHVTATAQEQLTKLLSQQKKAMMVRLYVVSGLHPTVHMNLDSEKPGDQVVKEGEVSFLIDPISITYLNDATVDCVVEPEGAAFRVTGPNVPQDLEEKAPPEEENLPPAKTPEEKVARVKKALKKVFDPEIPMNIVDLGLIYAMDWTKEGKLNIKMTMTSPGCPVIEMMAEEVKQAGDAAIGGDTIQVEVVWDPPWTPERMSEFAKRQFGYD
jgi:metal-sulfur cluster biosynthetic enzyme/Fe-S cluster assembly iron-binding protein IscA